MAARGRAPGALLAGMLLACRCALALNPALDVSQYAHMAWKIRDGFSKGAINAIAQTPDGYLWLGTEYGLLRFDGVRPVPWQPPSGQHLPSEYIFSLLAARDGTLWIGTRKGLVSWKGGQLAQHPELGEQSIFNLVEDRQGSVWAGGFAAAGTGRICEIQNASARCHGEDGSLGPAVLGLYEDREGRLWAGVKDGLLQWKPGPPKFYPLPGEANGIRGFAEAADGSLLIGLRGGVGRMVAGKTEMAYPYPGQARRFDAGRMLRDRDQGLWIGTAGGGLVHVHPGRTDWFTASDGLSGDYVLALAEDREGNVWVATNGGLDRFRELAAGTLSVGQGISNADVMSVLTARDGSIWIGTRDGLNRWDRGQVTVYRERGAPTPPGVREVVGPGLPQHGVQSLLEDGQGRIWVSTQQGVGYLENQRLISIPGTSGLMNLGVTVDDTTGELWIVNREVGLLHWLPSGGVQKIAGATLGHQDFASAIAADPVQGGVWLGFFLGGVAYFQNGQVRRSYATADGLGQGLVSHLRIDRDDTVWAATQGGLSRVKNGRVATLTSHDGLPCDVVNWSLEDDDHALWLGMACGLVRVTRAEWEAWSATADPSRRPMIHATVFDTSDGVRSQPEGSTYTAPAVKARDGRLWFANLDGAGVIDPRHLPFNKLPPPVHIEQIIADRKTYAVSEGKDRLRLPPLIRDLQIDYTALSLVAPEKVRFRYRLEGRDRDWIDAGTRRQVFYNDLRPGNYRFRVAASNNSGVWNEDGAFLDFAVAPAYYQTRWFLAASIAVALLLLAGLHQMRLSYLKRQIQVRMEERVGERLRIARDLHDTLLQSFQAVLLRLQALGYLLPDRPAEAGTTLERLIEETRNAVTEGRDAVEGLRSSTVLANDLAKAMGTLGEELIAEQKGQPCPTFRVEVLGKSRDLLPLVRDEVYRIGTEAIRNAFRHAHAGRIEVEIRYDPRELRLRVRDDGKGMDAQLLEQGGRAGHHGLPGMQERTKLAGGKLAVWSEPEAGTEIELTVPGSVAYAKSLERSA
jgi:signal transduction histidine kinase/ligand-binding sensor domain-containing protein